MDVSGSEVIDRSWQSQNAQSMDNNAFDVMNHRPRDTTHACHKSFVHAVIRSNLPMVHELHGRFRAGLGIGFGLLGCWFGGWFRIWFWKVGAMVRGLVSELYKGGV